MEGFCRRVGTNREQAWALAKEDAEVYRDSWRSAAMAPLRGVQAPESKLVLLGVNYRCYIFQKNFYNFEFIGQIEFCLKSNWILHLQNPSNIKQIFDENMST